MEVYSRKVFVGGFPFTCSNEDLNRTFSKFGKFAISWPNHRGLRPKNYAFLIFDDSISVKRFVDQFPRGTKNYFVTFMVGMRSARVQVRPWNIVDAIYCPVPKRMVNLRHTVFIGGILRTIRAEDLADAFAKFGEVVAASIDLDHDYRYPKGAGRVTFGGHCGYIAAMTSKRIEMTIGNEVKVYEIKPYITEMDCENCYGRGVVNTKAKYFCSAASCLTYYCEQCWNQIHQPNSVMNRAHHEPYGGFHSHLPVY